MPDGARAAVGPRTRDAVAGVAPWRLWTAFLGGLALLYFLNYLAQDALPGNNPRHPEGWWGWFDQGKFLASARALAALNRDPEQHWYPMGYALLGAPFVRLWPVHPFVLVNLASLLLTARMFVVFAGRAGVGTLAAMLLFVGASAADPLIFRHWTIPWNTAPAAAVIWTMLAIAAAGPGGRAWRPVALGALAAGLLWLRPSDLLVPATILAGALIWQAAPRPAGRPGGGPGALFRAAALMAAGGIAVAAAALGLHLLIYGARLSPYMAMSGDMGFSLHAYGWKAYNLLIEPRAWWLDGTGLLQRHPWLALALLGLPFAIAAGPAMAILSVAAAAYLAMYVAYIDLLPTGFWRFNNVHYFTWNLPAFALVAWVGIRAMARAPRWQAAAVALPVLMILAVRIDPVPATPGGGPMRALALASARPGFTETYFSPHGVRDARGALRQIYDVRFVEAPAGARVLALSRDIDPPVAAVSFPDVSAVQGLAPRYGVGWFCWLPPYACKRAPAP